MYTADDVKRFATAAIEGALVSAIDLSAEEGVEINISDDGLRSQAEMFAAEIMLDLRREVLAAIKTIKFKKFISAEIAPCE